MSRSRFSGDDFCLVVQGLGLSFSDGVQLFSDLSFSLGSRKVGLVGRNGSGKTQLLKVLMGQVPPSQGRVLARGSVGYLPQHPVFDSQDRVSDVLGVRLKLEALRAIEAGRADAHLFDMIGDDWDVETRLSNLLTNLGLEQLDLDRAFDSLSGGEATRVYLAGLMLRKPNLLVLDEPTNNLDIAARQALYRTLSDWKGGLLVVSHDRILLNLLDHIMELSSLGLKHFEGNYDHYCPQKTAEEAALRRSLKHGQSEIKRTKRVQQKNLEKHQQRQAKGRRDRRAGSQPKVVLNARQERSEASASVLKNSAERQLTQQKQALDGVRNQLEALETIDETPLGGHVPNGKTVLTINGLTYVQPGCSVPVLHDFNLTLCGPERVWLKGGNGCGKTTLLKLIKHAKDHPLSKLAGRQGQVEVGVERLVYLDQHVEVLEAGKTVFENFCRFQPKMLETEVRWRLAKFLFKGEAAFKKVHQLSGGERLRAAMACLFMGQDAPQLLLLDEPTNHLDLDAIASLEAMLRQYSGSLMVVSHDETFVKNIGLERVITFD